MESQYTLLLGFSYSLQPDSSPGSYNDQIAMDIRAWLSQNTKKYDNVLLAAQWEIIDALGADYSGPPAFPAPPPAFTAADFPDGKVDDFIRILTRGETDAACKLAEALRDLLAEVGYEHEPDDENSIFNHASLNAPRLAIYLNRLLEERDFYERFRHNVELHDLHRTNLGALGFETRQMPTGNGPLLRYQAMRVNRLIVESIVPDPKILKRGTYLSTHGVLENVLDHFKEKLPQIQSVVVFGFPAHSPRCRRQTIEAFWKAGHHINAHDVKEFKHVARKDWKGLSWDHTTAQIWCRNERNWLDYEAMGQRRL